MRPKILVGYVHKDFFMILQIMSILKLPPQHHTRSDVLKS